MYRLQKRGQATREEYRNVIGVCRGCDGKAKSHLVEGVKDNKEGFFKYIRSKRKTREDMGLLLCGSEAVVLKDSEKEELLNAFFFASVFTPETSPLVLWILETREEVQKKEDFPMMEEAWVRNHLGVLNFHRSTGLDGMYP